MPQAIAVRCPHCGASLQVDPRADSATCAYCGTTSLLRGKPTAAPGGAPVIVVRPGGGFGMVIFAVVVAVVVMAVLALTFTSSRPSPPVAAVAVQEAAPIQVAVASEPPAPAIDDAPRREVERLETGRRPLLADVDGDGLDDVIALATLHEGARRWDAFVAFSGATGEQLWQVAVPEDARGTFAAVAHGRLLLLGGAGQVSAHDLATGQQQWSTALGDRGLRLCAATEPDAVLVPTADARVLQLDIKTGKQSPTKPSAACAPLPGDQDLADDDPRDRTDTRAPPGVVGVRCGSVRVMGSQNFTVPDACRKRAQVDPDRLGGLVAHALWQTPQGWLILGVRDPGTHTPLLARMQDRALAWKTDVPDGNPLLADEGGPSPVTLAGDLVVAGYTLQKDSRHFIGAFALSDGARRWHIEAPGGKRVDRAAAAGKQLLLYAGGSIFVLDVTTGALLRTIGPAPVP